MKSKVQRDLRRLRRSLSTTSWENYRKLIGMICLDHIGQTWSAPITKFLYDQDISGLVAYADSLVAQKHATASEHLLANQIASLIRKYPFPKHLNPFDPEAKARDTFAKYEDVCRRMNEKFSNQDLFWSESQFRSEFQQMYRFCRYVLGDSPDLTDIYSKCYFGPGASVGVHGNATNLKRKIASDWSVSPSAFLLARSAVLNNWHLTELLARKNVGGYVCLDPELLYQKFKDRCAIRAYNKLAFVPKTATTFRSIAVEPLLNGYVQTGVDQVLRGRLRRIGINLSDQSINSEMARQGSLSDGDDSFVTIDLSSASDSISIGLCRLLLPPDWFDLLNSIRSSSYADGTKVTRYHKFCSMGNGFCFPLETLLFTAACASLNCGKAGVDYHVYGDDIIVRKRFATKLISLLQEMGFEVNSKKTFLEGPFRESCGTDWYNGVDVRPFILDFELNELSSLFKILNLSKRSSLTTMFFSGVSSFLKGLIPDNLKFWRPLAGPSDTAVTVERDEFMSSPFAKWSRDLQCWEWTELIHRPVCDRGDLRDSDLSLLMAALRGSSSSSPFVIRRKTRTGVRRVAYA